MALWIRFLVATALLLFRACFLVANANCGPHVVETDSLLAERTQQQHLHALFLKYGKNGTMSLSGLRRLLEGLGLDRIRRVTVQHLGNKHENTQSHAHKHDTHTLSVGSKKDSNMSSLEKSDSTSSVHPESASMKKRQLAVYHNLYMKRDSDATAILTTQSYITKSHWEKRSANYNLMDSSQSNATNSSGTYYTEDTSAHDLDDYNRKAERSPLSYNYSQEVNAK